jgi:hypothetical protein
MNNIEVALIVTCPHCGDPVIIEQINCRIFRHAVYKNTGEQMDPHASKEVCDKARMDGIIYGCGRPFFLDASGCAVVCVYI